LGDQSAADPGKFARVIPGEAIFDSYVLTLDKSCVVETLDGSDQQFWSSPAPIRSAPQLPASPRAALAQPWRDHAGRRSA